VANGIPGRERRRLRVLPGSGVKGDGVLNAIDFAGTEYTFAESVKLTGKDQCKRGGWATSTSPEFRNQGECVSSFASSKK
jgi:hypothetical protein